jgi:hypothetical protein
MRKVLRASLLVAAAILGAADPFDLSERAPSVRSRGVAADLPGVRQARADSLVGNPDRTDARSMPATRPAPDAGAAVEP